MVYQYSPRHPPHIPCAGPSLQAFGQASAPAAEATPASLLLLGAADASCAIAAELFTTATPPTTASHVATPAVKRPATYATEPAVVRHVGGLLSPAEIESNGADPRGASAAAADSAASAAPVAADTAAAAAAAATAAAVGRASASGSGAAPAASTSAASAAAAGGTHRLIFVPTATDVATVEKLVASLAAPGPSGEDANLLLTFTQLRCNLEGARVHLASARPEEVGYPAPLHHACDEPRGGHFLFSRTQAFVSFPLLTHRGCPLDHLGRRSVYVSRPVWRASA